MPTSHNTEPFRQDLLGFRDVAGARCVDGRVVGPGRLYRSGTPQFLDADDAATLVREKGLRSVIDLRLPREVQQEGSGGLRGAGPTHTNVPFAIRKPVAADSAVAPMRGTDPLVWTYINYLGDGSAFVRLAHALADVREGACLVHCTVGKDRTGVAIAMVLEAIGVLRADVAKDYGSRAEDVAAMMRRLPEMVSYRAARDVYPPEAYGSDPTTILRFLSWVDRTYGGPREYLRAVGVTDAQLDTIADRLLVDTAAEPTDQVLRSVELDAEPDAVWGVVGDVGAVASWVPPIVSCTVADGVRAAEFADGGTAHEAIIDHDDTQRSYTYRYLDGPIPLGSYESTIHVGPKPDGGGAVVVWNATLRGEADVIAGIGELYDAALRQLSVAFAKGAETGANS